MLLLNNEPITSTGVETTHNLYFYIPFARQCDYGFAMWQMCAESQHELDLAAMMSLMALPETIEALIDKAKDAVVSKAEERRKALLKIELCLETLAAWLLLLPCYETRSVCHPIQTQ